MLKVLGGFQISQRRACVLIGVDPKSAGGGHAGGMAQSRARRERPPDHGAIRVAMREVAGKRRRFGYRRIGVMLERQGLIMNHKKLYRIYREEGLSVRRRRGRKRARGSCIPMPMPLIPGARWSMDFVSDTFGASRKFRILAINDDCCRENLCLVADTSISGARVARELDTLVRLYGKPACIVSDDGTEFTSRAILEWAGENKVEWHYIDPGKALLSLSKGLSRMGSSNPSTARCAMNCSTRNCSTAWPMPAGSWLSGATITTMSGPTRRWEGAGAIVFNRKTLIMIEGLTGGRSRFKTRHSAFN